MLRFDRHLTSYRETAPILYSKNMFTFYSAKVLFAFTQRILPQRLAQIRKINLATVLIGKGSLYRDPFVLGDYSSLLTLFADVPGTRVVCLSHRIASRMYIQKPRVYDFGLLQKIETEETMEGCTMFYEIIMVYKEEEEEDDDMGREEVGRLLFGRWEVGERVKIGRVE
jgi:hypothetical protein